MSFQAGPKMISEVQLAPRGIAVGAEIKGGGSIQGDGVSSLRRRLPGPFDPAVAA